MRCVRVEKYRERERGPDFCLVDEHLSGLVRAMKQRILREFENVVDIGRDTRCPEVTPQQCTRLGVSFTGVKELADICDGDVIRINRQDFFKITRHQG